MRLTNHEKILISKYEYVFVELRNPISNWKLKNNTKYKQRITEKVRLALSIIKQTEAPYSI